jgi:23S rRNA (pseudouridine1915-N3)-methyltransferase
MRLLILAVGHKMPAWVSAGFDDYARRMPRDTPLQLVEVRPQPRGAAAGTPAQVGRMLMLEAQRLRSTIPTGATRVALDEHGRPATTHELARLLEDWRRSGRDVAFLVGGADGLEPELKRSAHLMLSLSAMTLPHQLVRVLLAEQLYRAASLLQRHPYHRA